jgi:hypothetical protein
MHRHANGVVYLARIWRNNFGSARSG